MRLQLLFCLTLNGKRVGFPSCHNNLPGLTRLMNHSFIATPRKSLGNVQLGQILFIGGTQILAVELSQIPW